MSKLFLGLLLVLVVTGCGSGVEVSEPTLEKTPWLFPEPNIKQLSSPDFAARATAARSLGRMGAKAKAAIPELEKLLEDENPKLRKIAEESLEKIRAAIGED